MIKRFFISWFNAMVEARQKQVNAMIARGGYIGY